MVDNFSLIDKMLTFETEDEFYMLQIIKRKKENPDMKGDSIPVKTVYLNREGQLMEIKDDLVKMADMYNARIYINLNVKSFKKVTCATLGELAKRIASDDYHKPYKVWDSCAGQAGGCRDTRWLLDVDVDELDGVLAEKVQTGGFFQYVKEKLGEYQPLGDKVVGCVPTKHGFHVITKPFDPRNVSVDFPGISLHKNNPTLVYCR